MNHSSNRPQDRDAVLGGRVSGNDGILGGLEGVKRRLASHSEQERIIALKDTLQYGQEGLELLISTIKVEAGLVQWKAYELLAPRIKEKEKLQLQRYLIFLHSPTGANYRNLSNLLTQGRWEEADKETSKVLVKAAGQGNKGWLNDKELKKIPQPELHNINLLWTKHSQGRFGFGVQKRIYQQVGEDYNKFGDRVGWRIAGRWFDYGYLSWNLDAPWGHLPALVSRPIRPHIYHLSTLLSLI